MKMLKKFVSCLFITAISSYAYADIIELDASNTDHCRQQILHSTDELPVIASYDMNQFPDSESFMNKFEMLAKQHPEKTFFKWNAEKDVMHTTQSLCLQQLGLTAQPNLIMVGVFKNDDTGAVFMTSPLRLSWAGEMTIAEMNKFIDISDKGTKRSVLSQKNRH